MIRLSRRLSAHDGAGSGNHRPTAGHAAAIGLATAMLLTASAICAQSIDTLAIRSDTRVLADDSMMGRGLGSAGAEAAARYISGRLRAIGLTPAGADGGFLQPVPVLTTRIEAGSRIVIHNAGDSASFVNERDYVHGRGGGRAFQDFSGPSIFAGTAGTALRIIGDRDIAGRVVVIAGTLPEDADALLRHLVARNAAALLQLVPDPDYLARLSESLGDERFEVTGVDDEPRWQPRLPLIPCGPRMARAILLGGDIADAALEGRIAEPLPLAWTVSATVRKSTHPVAAANIIAVLPGADDSTSEPELLYTAHYDHLGIIDGTADSIYNGFSDNAAGVGMLLAIAAALRGARPPAPVAFAFMTGEESGLLGSSWFAEHPGFPLSRLRAVVNLDGGAPPRAPVSWRLAGDTTAPITRLAARVVRNLGWEPVITGTRANSDHWPFLSRGIPAVFLIPGNDWENTTTAERDRLRAEFDHYHQPGDAWRTDFPFAGLGRYAMIALEIGRATLQR